MTHFTPNSKLDQRTNTRNHGIALNSFSNGRDFPISAIMASDRPLPYTPELFASQISRAASRFLEPDAKIRPDLIRKPDPITLYLGYFGTNWWRSTYAGFLVARLQDGSYQVGRRLTQPEVDAYVDSHNSFVTNFRRGLPLGFFVGGAKFFVYEKNYRHLLTYAPPATQEGMSPVRRYLEGTRALFKSDTALARKLLGSLSMRLLAYTMGGGFGLQVAAALAMNWKLQADPRMQQHAADSRKQPPEKVRERRNQALKERAAGQQQGQGQAQQPSDEPTPQSIGYEQTGYVGDSSSVGSATTTDSINASTYPTTGTATGTYSYSAPVGQTKQRGFFDDDDEDDASPTAPEYRGIVRQEKAAAQGSAWERIRNQAQNPTASEPASLSGGSWDRSDSSIMNNDGQRERERAQAEFNRMLEAERNLSNESGASRSSVWR
ncbi:hypothetical protein BJX63DRAFT_393567 [Aspergillus granulosus]|uniref:Uncharacterized protein n=1 Tax=Aspergillus granulosus TaxID=176169 RepID=A0ABR4HFH7_9EURO